jgi:hypothetical protein
MKFLVRPCVEHLAKVVQGLAESYPEAQIEEIVEYVNKWPGVQG